MSALLHDINQLINSLPNDLRPYLRQFREGARAARVARKHGAITQDQFENFERAGYAIIKTLYQEEPSDVRHPRTTQENPTGRRRSCI